MLNEHTPQTSKATKKRRKRSQGLVCGVCGRSTRRYHFGGPACETCKVFFRRVVQKGTYRRFECSWGGHCSVAHVVRLKCSACRFAKCLENRMDPKWVMSNEERQKKRDEVLRIDRVYNPDPKDLVEILTEEEMSTVRTMVLHFKETASQVCIRDVADNICNTVGVDLQSARRLSLGTTFNFRVIRFAYELPEFSSLQRATRHLLVENAMTQMFTLRFTYEFDNCKKCWPSERSYDKYSVIFYEEYIDKVSATFLQKFYAYCENVHKLAMDEPCLLLLMLITLLNTGNCAGLTEIDKIDALQERFLSILSKYVRWKYGALNSNVVFPKLLGLLTETQNLSGKKSEKDIWMDDFEYEYLRRTFGRLNPFREYSLEKRNEVFVPASVDPYAVLDDSTPTVDMFRRGATSVHTSIARHEKRLLQPLSLREKSLGTDIPSDLFSLLEERSDDESSLQEFNSDCTSEGVFSDQQSVSSPWCPEEFDLSWCGLHGI